MWHTHGWNIFWNKENPHFAATSVSTTFPPPLPPDGLSVRHPPDRDHLQQDPATMDKGLYTAFHQSDDSLMKTLKGKLRFSLVELVKLIHKP